MAVDGDAAENICAAFERVMKSVAAIPYWAKARPVLDSNKLLAYHDQSIVHRTLLWLYVMLPAVSLQPHLIPKLKYHLSHIIVYETGNTVTEVHTIIHQMVFAVFELLMMACQNAEKRRILVALPYVVQVALSSRHGTTRFFQKHQLKHVAAYVIRNDKRDDTTWTAVRYYYVIARAAYVPFAHSVVVRYKPQVATDALQVMLQPMTDSCDLKAWSAFWCAAFYSAHNLSSRQKRLFALRSRVLLLTSFSHASL